MSKQTSRIPTFNLRAVTQEVGIKPDTLRAWERRYNLPNPQRSRGGHRLYSQRDIDTLKWLMGRQQEGMSISRAVDLWRRLESEEQDPLVAKPHPTPETRIISPLVMGDPVTELRQAWVRACAAFDEQGAEQIITQAFALYPVELVCLELLRQGLSDLAHKPQETAHLHFASILAGRRLATLTAATPRPTRVGRIVVGGAPQENDTFSLALLVLLLRRQGWNILYLGAAPNLTAAIPQIKPQLILLLAQQLATARTLLTLAQALRQERIPLAYGGEIFETRPALCARIPGYYWGEGLDIPPAQIEQFMASPSPVAEENPETLAAWADSP